VRYEHHVVCVFPAGPNGGNPAPIVMDAAGMSDAQMQDLARTTGHESGFVFPSSGEHGCDFTFRYWVPNHEMAMCGHATVGAVWLLERLGRLPRDIITIETRSGIVEARVSRHPGQDPSVEISQPRGIVEPLPNPKADEADILSVLGITGDERAPIPIQNARTSRIKTLIPLKSVEVLDRLRPDFGVIESLCERIGSTGLYPYAMIDPQQQIAAARQFPKSSGYPEDPATGIAATALAFGLLENGLVGAPDRPVTVRQGWAMGRPSEITIRFRLEDGTVTGCWLGGPVRLEDETQHG
jgi:PhzF family phenazine biosynthesis protein